MLGAGLLRAVTPDESELERDRVLRWLDSSEREEIVDFLRLSSA